MPAIDMMLCIPLRTHESWRTVCQEGCSLIPTRLCWTTLEVEGYRRCSGKLGQSRASTVLWIWGLMALACKIGQLPGLRSAALESLVKEPGRTPKTSTHVEAARRGFATFSHLAIVLHAGLPQL
ncbi:hypothetical protein OH77DRAFT_847598 [Trametes cingulata]|nr:hypothetical protein OH77DRAFT_847598 [Trametes cingulata]